MPLKALHSASLTAWFKRIGTATLLMIAGTPLCANALNSQAVFENSEDAVYQVRVINRQTGKKNTIGSGFIYQYDNRLATNYHVVSTFIDKPDDFELRYLASNGSEGALRLVAVDAVHDLALVEADHPLGAPFTVGEPPPKGATLFAMGNPLDLGLSIAAGTNGGVLSQTDESRILFSGSLNPGMSGGPTFDEQGVVVGINVSTASNDISFIVPARYLERIPVIDEASPKTFLKVIGNQIHDYQVGYIDRINNAAWPPTDIRHIRAPGSVSPTIRCWDGSPKQDPEDLYRRYSIRCQNENDIYLTDRLNVGRIIYEYLWLESDQLEPMRFYRLYSSLNNSQFSAGAKKDDVTRFRCTTRFVDVNGHDFKTTICKRDYKNYPGLSDVLFTAAMLGEERTGFIFNIDLSGTDYNAAVRLIARFLKEIRWQP